MITNACLNLSEYLLLVGIRSIQGSFPLKHELIFIKLVRLLLSKNSYREESLGSILKTPILQISRIQKYLRFYYLHQEDMANDILGN